MKELVVISGKGGTGKTSLVASLAVLAGRAVVADCDVDAADLHLVMDPRIIREEDFTGGKCVSIIPEKCAGCGKCRELCRFGAVVRRKGEIPGYFIDHLSCEGCGVCSYFCPEKAIEFRLQVNGRWFISQSRSGPMVHARLGIASENSGKLVSLVRGQARKIAENENLPYIISDGPPGTGCPVIASVTGADAVLIVAEPTVSGDHDMKRVAELCAYFKVPAYLCVNKFDLNAGMCRRIEENAGAAGVQEVGRIHFDRAVTEAQLEGLPVTLFKKSAAAEDIRKIWENLNGQLNRSQKRGEKH
ncbi:MAG: ATP-binding protein [Bacillota bacterium]